MDGLSWNGGARLREHMCCAAEKKRERDREKPGKVSHCKCQLVHNICFSWSMHRQLLFDDFLSHS